MDDLKATIIGKKNDNGDIYTEKCKIQIVDLELQTIAEVEVGSLLVNTGLLIF